MANPEALDLKPADLRVGLRAHFDVSVTAESVAIFSSISGDYNPLHIDPAYAIGTVYERPIAHGAYQIGLASAMVGMRLPGRSALLGSVHARFPSPLYYPSLVRVEGEVTSWDTSSHNGTLKVVVRELSSGSPTAEITIAFALHHMRSNARAVTPVLVRSLPAGDTTGRRKLLVTGGTGGIGSHLVRSLAGEFDVLAMVHKTPLPPEIRELPNVTEVRTDVASPLLSETIANALNGAPLYGVVHAAWPGAPHGGLLQVADETLDIQIQFGTKHLIRLANVLFANAGQEGGRFVAIGSTYATEKPLVHLASYSLGKAAMEHTVRLLATELARRKLTINLVSPSLIASGMNKTVTERQQMKEAAYVPMSRICQPEDVDGAVRYLLSDRSAFFSGQVLQLTGAQL
jgi:3-oxoacyl-[acyl-carrier protein] reductase